MPRVYRTQPSNIRGTRPSPRAVPEFSWRPANEATSEEPIKRLNELIDELARDEDVPVLPFYATLESPDDHGRMRDEWTSDGDHPSVEGYRRLGELAFRLP